MQRFATLAPHGSIQSSCFLLTLGIYFLLIITGPITRISACFRIKLMKEHLSSESARLFTETRNEMPELPVLQAAGVKDRFWMSAAWLP